MSRSFKVMLTSCLAALALLGSFPCQGRVLLQAGTFCAGKADGLYQQSPCGTGYWQCWNGFTYAQPCPTGLAFDTAITACNWPSAIPACTSTPPSSPVNFNPTPSPANPIPSPSPRNPSPSPLILNPSPSPLTQNPSPSPAILNPSPSPLAQNPSPSPVILNPSPSPLTQNPSPSPLTQTPSASPAVASRSPAVASPSTAVRSPIVSSPSPRVVVPSPSPTSSGSSCTSTSTSSGACGNGVCCGVVSGVQLCCSQWGYCGTTSGYCGAGCQSQWGRCGTPSPVVNSPTPVSPVPLPSPPTGGGKVASYLSEALYNTLFPQPYSTCTGEGFYTYQAFMAATAYYPLFASQSSDDNNRRELAAFLAQISHETTGGTTSGGLCWIQEGEYGGTPTSATYCDSGSTQYPCTPGKSYRGRGPIQLSWNYNYGQAAAALGLPLLTNPDLVAQDAVVAFRTALWFWMTAQGAKPSCHDVMIGAYAPTADDIAAGRVLGFGWTTVIINGGLECGYATPDQVKSRVAYFQRYAPLLSTTTGDNLYCNNMRPY